MSALAPSLVRGARRLLLVIDQSSSRPMHKVVDRETGEVIAGVSNIEVTNGTPFVTIQIDEMQVIPKED